MKNTKLIVLAVSIVVVLLGYLVFRYLNRRSRSKYGFMLTESRHVNLSDAEAAKRTFESFIFENDSAIRDVLNDYADAHPEWGDVSYDNGQWSLKLKTGRKAAQDDCIVRCHMRPSYEDGRLQTTVEIQLPGDLAERHVLLKALKRTIRRSKAGRRVGLILSDR